MVFLFVRERPESYTVSHLFCGVIQGYLESSTVFVTPLSEFVDMPLTDTQIRTFKPTGKIVKLYDGGGLLLRITARGKKCWQFKYTRNGKQNTIGRIGSYPEVSLKEAREKALILRKKIIDGIDPAQENKERRLMAEVAARTFEVVAREWHEKYARTWTEGHARDNMNRLERFLFPALGSLPVAEIRPQDVLEPLRRLEEAGILETAHRVCGLASMVFRYSVASGYIESDPCRDLRGALTPRVKRHHATIIDPKAVGSLLRAIDEYRGAFVVQCALKLLPLVFVRSGELRGARWTEVDLAAKEWRIPAERMKMKEAHVVPLSRQAVALLEHVKLVTGYSDLVFPSPQDSGRGLSDVTLTAALRRLGYAPGEMTIHGFRATASTLLNELGFHPDLIELQLAHKERNKVRASYNHAVRLSERVDMMQRWADYLDELKRI